MHIYVKSGDDQWISDRKLALVQLISRAGLKLGRPEVEEYFKRDREIIVAIDKGAITGVCVIRRTLTESMLFIGYELAVVDAKYCGRGLLGRMTAYYLLGNFPRILWLSLTNSVRAYVYADISNPISYRRMHIGQRIFPNLISGDRAEDATEGRQVREALIHHKLVDGLDPMTGLVSGGSSAQQRQASLELGSQPWKISWSSYVPADRDLIAIFPVDRKFLSLKILKLIQLAVSPKRYFSIQPMKSLSGL